MRQQFPIPSVDHTLIGATVTVRTNTVPFGIESNRKTATHHGVVKGVHELTTQKGGPHTEVSITFTDGRIATYEAGVDEATVTVREARAS